MAVRAVWALPLLVALIITLLAGGGTLVEVAVNTLAIALLPAMALGFMEVEGMSSRGLVTCALSLSVIPCRLELDARIYDQSGWLWLENLLVMPGACLGAIGALAYDNRVRERSRIPRASVMAG